MTVAGARKAWETRRAAGGASASAQLAHRTRMRARARELGVPVFTTPRLVLSLPECRGKHRRCSNCPKWALLWLANVMRKIGAARTERRDQLPLFGE